MRCSEMSRKLGPIAVVPASCREEKSGGGSAGTPDAIGSDRNIENRKPALAIASRCPQVREKSVTHRNTG